ncbi:MAG: deoxyhypusine synthase [Polyangiaceae bacterium]
MGAVRDFITHHYRHFNAAVVIDAAKAWEEHLARGGKMLLTVAGAMSTAEMGLVMAELIRKGKVHGIVCTGANLEEDVFNLVAHNSYKRIPGYRQLTAEQEKELEHQGLNRVTDTCIPEGEAMRKIESHMLELWADADKKGERFFPHELFYKLLRSKKLEKDYEIDPKDSWLLAACEKNLPMWVPGYEDSTLANMFVAAVVRGDVKSPLVIKSGLEQMRTLVDWYREESARSSIGFFQIGGGIAGDFPICVVPLIHQDLQEQCPYWGYFCQISDSTTSYGSYSGAVPNEKITWGKLDIDTPRFIIESDATIVFPLVAAYLLNM